MRIRNLVLSSILSVLCGMWIAGVANAQDEQPVQAFMTNAAIFVKDMDKSLVFYTEYMGLMSRSDSEITAGKSKDTLGIDQEIDTRIVYLSPKPEFTEPDSFAGGLALIEVKNDAAHEFNRMMDSIKAVHGETAMVYRVQNINRIYKSLVDNGVPIVTPLSPSGSGRSMSFSAFDPNGIRVEMYEMIPQEN